MRVDEFRYELPEERIAQTPVEPRDAARLIRASDLSDHVVRDLPDLLSPGDLVVVNNTAVRAARLRGRRRETGGAVEVLLLRPIDDRWEAMVRPARRLRAGTVVDVGRLSVRLETNPVDGVTTVSLDAAGGSVEDVIEAEGEMPLPPYIHERLSDPGRYQTIYADRVGSAAAPTAGLHFSTAMFERLEQRGIGVTSIELQVGLDTFRPISSDEVEGHEMHSEWIAVSDEAVEAVRRTRAGGGRVVAIGTTVVRALESAAGGRRLTAMEGPTRLYITPGYRFEVVDSLMTNFHIPGSSLLVLVAAFAGEGWRDVYSAALDRDYRFLSFGDACLFERKENG